MSFITEPAGASPTRRTTDAEFALGTKGRGNNGTEWLYVKASVAISQYYVGAVTEAFLMAPATAALASEGHIPAFPQTAFAINEYGWVPTKGSGDLKIKTLGAIVKDSALYVAGSGASAGQVSLSTSGTLLNGVVTVSTAASAGALPLIIATSPWFTP
jgi:hypothetical protein